MFGWNVPRLASWLFFLTLISAMSMTDDAPYSYLPSMLLLLLLLIFFVVALLRGLRLPSLPFLFWLSLLVAAFFYGRGMVSYSQLEGWGLGGLVLGAVVAYGAGFVFRAHGLKPHHLSVAMLLALLVNALYWLVSHGSDLPLTCWGRSTLGLDGLHSRPCSLFIYKNFASAFFVSGAVFLLALLLWIRQGRWWGRLSLLVALLSLGLSFCCDSRVPWLLLPSMLLLGCLLSLLLRVGEGRPMAWGHCVLLLLFLGLGGYVLSDFFGEMRVYQSIAELDSHLRFDIWADICRILPAAPLWGYGAGAAQWEIIPFFADWSSPNYAHQEYLQCWADFGLLGLGLMLLLLALHMARGCLYLLMEPLDVQERGGMAAVLLLVMAWLLYASFDFVWHQFALVMMGAFLCSYLAYPRGGLHWLRDSWTAGALSNKPLRPVRDMGAWERRALLALTLIVAWGLILSIHRFAPVYWQERVYAQKVQAGMSAEEEFGFLEKSHQLYPDAAIVSWALRLPLAKNEAYYRRLTLMLQSSLAANPKNLFALTLLAQILDRLGEYEQAEALLRAGYPQEGLPNTPLCSWATYYGRHLLAWGLSLAEQGEHGVAISMLQQALRMNQKNPLRYQLEYRPQIEGHQNMDHLRQRYRHDWQVAQELMDDCQRILRAYHSHGFKADHRWKQPQHPQGKAALYP